MGTKWRYRINIGEIWERARDKEITIQELAKYIVKEFKLRLGSAFGEDTEFGDIIDNLESIAEDRTENQEDLMEMFDDIWGEVYAWADKNRVWISTTL